MAHHGLHSPVGETYGRLTVREATDERAADGSVKFRCVCVCGGEALTTAFKLRSGHTRSCGCLQRERSKEANTRHGCCRRSGQHRLYTTWASMRNRCNNPRSPDYKWWGARGVKVCNEWNGSKGFPNFRDHASGLAHYGEPGRSLDRIDNEGDYEPGNVRWATHGEQSSQPTPATTDERARSSRP